MYQKIGATVSFMITQVAISTDIHVNIHVNANDFPVAWFSFTQVAFLTGKLPNYCKYTCFLIGFACLTSHYVLIHMNAKKILWFYSSLHKLHFQQGNFRNNQVNCVVILCITFNFKSVFASLSKHFSILWNQSWHFQQGYFRNCMFLDRWFFRSTMAISDGNISCTNPF